MSEQNILEVRNLTKHFKAGGRQVVHAVDDVSLTLKRAGRWGLSASRAAESQAVPERLSECTIPPPDRSFWTGMI